MSTASDEHLKKRLAYFGNGGASIQPVTEHRSAVSGEFDLFNGHFRFVATQPEFLVENLLNGLSEGATVNWQGEKRRSELSIQRNAKELRIDGFVELQCPPFERPTLVGQIGRASCRE